MSDKMLNDIYSEVNEIKQKMFTGSYTSVYDLLNSINNNLKELNAKLSSIQKSIDERG